VSGLSWIGEMKGVYAGVLCAGLLRVRQMVYDPALLEQGKCDVVASKELSAAELAAAAEADKAAASNRLQCKEKSPSGEDIEFEILFDNKMKTNGGGCTISTSPRTTRRPGEEARCLRPRSCTVLHTLLCTLLCTLQCTVVYS